MLINNKIKQFFAGNWGKPKDFEHARTPKIEELERVRTGKKKTKKTKKVYIYEGHLCPFCKTELIKLPVDNKDAMSWIFEPRETQCRNCESWQVNECPACKRKTWYNYTTRIYKHQNHGCGFIGEIK